MRSLRRLAFLIICVLFIQMIPAGAASEEEYRSPKEIEADMVIGYLLGEEFFASETVTRAEFTGALVRLFGMQASSYQSIFADVTEDTPYAAEICAACAAGIVSEAENFEPDQPVQYEHALKMLVNTLGYEAMAEFYGGYPVGYFAAAEQMDLLEGVSQNEGSLTVPNVKRLLYNLMSSTIRFTGIGDGYAKFEKSSMDYFESLYQLRRTEGVVTATQYNSYRISADIFDKPFIEIDGVSYDCETCTPDLLGKRICAYYNTESGEIAVFSPVENKELTVSLKDVTSWDGSVLEYYDEQTQKSKTCSTNGSVTIYNDRAVSGLTLDGIEGDTGSIRLLDNDRDGKYEYLFLSSYQYVYVKQVDWQNKRISDHNASDPVFKAVTDDTVFFVADAEGNSREFSDIQKNTLVMVSESADGALVTIRECGGQVSGTITRLTNDGKIYIDDTCYEISPYAQKNYPAALTPGGTGSFMTGADNDIVVVGASGAAMQYGYLIDGAVEPNFDETVKLKIFTTEEEITVFDAEKVSFNESNEKLKGNKILTLLGGVGSVTPQLIRYKTDGEGKKIVHIDTAETEFDFAEKAQDVENSLRKYTFTSNGTEITTFNYRSGGKSCAPYFNLNNSIIFSVPTDEEVKMAEGKEFRISDTNDLVSSKNYAFEVYDLSEGGTAGVVVLKGEIVSGMQGYMIESVAEGVLPDETVGTIINAYGRQAYKTFYLEKETEAELGRQLCPGDIVELTANEQNVIDAITLVFDASSDIPKPNLNAGGDIRFESPTSNSYFYGALYASDGTYAYLSKTEDGAGGFLYGFSDLINLKLQTSNMAIINAARTEIRPITISELKDYKSFGNENYYIVVRLSYQSPDAVYVYER